ncbi:MAG TPA: diaminopimelate decarboxylase, partial [Cyclobacteriaceae bacterium]
MELTGATYQIQGLDVTSLAKQFGTPLYVYDANTIIRQINNLKTAFTGTDIKIKYAAKALTNISILKLIRKHGAGVDVVSLYEAQLAMKADYQANEIMFTPSGVDFSEIEEGVRSGYNINIDNLSSLKKFGEKYGNTYPCCLRLNPSILAGGNIKISTGHSSSKFGIAVQQMPEILSLVSQYKIHINGLHIHT